MLRVFIILLFLCSQNSVSGQDIQFPETKISLETLIQTVENSTSYLFTYNPSILKEQQVIELESTEVDLKELLNTLNVYYPYDTYLDRKNNKVVLSGSDSYHIRAIVIDSISGERLPHVVVQSTNDKVATTNDEGIFKIKIKKDEEYVSLSYLGYRKKKISLKEFSIPNTIIRLNTENFLIDITIKDTPILQNTIGSDHKANPRDVRQSYNIGGNGDLFSYLRTRPSVSKGAEGQNGLSVRGGAHDQNLILMDGIPIYEASHLGGLSSIFITEAIKDINFYDSAFPAEFDGKLSSVVDVRLKEGNNYEIKKSVKLGIEGLQLHTDGPITEKTTFNLNGKLSLFGPIVDRILENSLNLIEPDFSYYDLYGKLSHRFSSSTKLTFSSYVGYDQIALSANSNVNSDIEDFNFVDWGNRMHALNFTSSLNDNLFFKSVIGFSNYKYKSQGSYRIQIPNDPQAGLEEFTILSRTEIKDYVFKPTFEYYKESNGSISFGGQFIRHSNFASIVEDDVFNDAEINNAVLDSLYESTELAVFIEDKSYFSKDFWMELGLRYNAFLIGKRTYQSFNPRVSLKYHKDNTHVTLSYAKMNQFIHLLANPGPGLPSDLWVPSTSNVAPQNVNSISFNTTIKIKSTQFGISAYYKIFDNLIEYENPFDIIYSYVIDRRKYNIETDNRSWEERVSTGTGKAIGFELDFKYSKSKFDFDFAYSYSRAKRVFEEIDAGEEFSFRYDRPHNLNANLKYKLNPNMSFSAFYTYASGNAYTLADESIITPDGGEVLIAKGRNRARVPHFSHLDLDFNTSKQFTNGAVLNLSLGVYNVLNRYNPYFVYIEEDTNDRSFKLKQISLYPRFPRFNVSYNW